MLFLIHCFLEIPNAREISVEDAEAQWADRSIPPDSESVKGKGKRCSSLISVEGHFGDFEVKAYILKLVGSKNVKTDENCVF